MTNNSKKILQKGGSILPVYYKEYTDGVLRDKIVVYDTTDNEIEYGIMVKGAPTRLIRHIEIKLKTILYDDETFDIMIPDEQKAQITYYSDEGNIQAIFNGIVKVNPDDTHKNLFNINPKEGVMERKATDEQLTFIFNGFFGNSTRIKSGTIICPENKISFTSTEYIYIKKDSLDVYMFKPEINSVNFSDYDTDRFNHLYLYTAKLYNGKAYLSLKEIMNNLQRGTYEAVVKKYSNILSKCKDYGRSKLKIFDKIINDTVVDGLCNIVFLSAIKDENIDVNKYFDELVKGKIEDAIKNAQILQNEPKSAYDRTNKIHAVNESYYKNVMYPMDIRLYPDELEILVPFDIDKKQHIYYQWITVGTNTENYELFVDTGNHSISGMSYKYFMERYMSSVGEDIKNNILKIILDTKTKCEGCVGIGGKCCTEHKGFIEITFRFAHAHYKGVFKIDCDIHDSTSKEKVPYDILIGDVNRMGSKLRSSNMKYLLNENRIYLKYDPKNNIF